jgi:hypothetical protein
VALPQRSELTQLRDVADSEAADAFVDLVLHGTDREIVRINPMRVGRACGLEQRSVVDMFLHARKLGLVKMEWQFVCPGCGEVVESLASLTAASSHYFCEVCSVDRSTDMTDFVEVVFTVSPNDRRSAFHDPWSLDPVNHFLQHRFASNSFVGDRSVADHLRSCMVSCHYVDAGHTISIDADAAPELLWFTNGPALEVLATATGERRQFEFELKGVESDVIVHRLRSAAPLAKRHR